MPILPNALIGRTSYVGCHRLYIKKYKYKIIPQAIKNMNGENFGKIIFRLILRDHPSVNLPNIRRISSSKITFSIGLVHTGGNA